MNMFNTSTMTGFLAMLPPLLTSSDFSFISVAFLSQIVLALAPVIGRYAKLDLNTTLQIRESDPAFQAMQYYLSTHARRAFNQRPSIWRTLLEKVWPTGGTWPAGMELDTAPHDKSSSIRSMSGRQVAKGKVGRLDASEVDVKPSMGGGALLFHFRGHLIQAKVAQHRLWPYPEVLTLSSFWTKPALFLDLINEARELHASRVDPNHLVVHEPFFKHQEASWRSLTRTKRLWDSVVLPNDVKATLYADALEFYAESEFYREIGQPWRRGWILHGLPGTGKSSLIAALASKLSADLYIVSLSASWLNDTLLSELLKNIPERSILLMEDIDCAMPERKKDNEDEEGGPAAEKKEEADKNDDAPAGAAPTGGPGKPKGQKGDVQVTLSGLLNALDGVVASEGRIFVATTNHLEKIDSALSRPGRCDVWVEFTHATRSQARELFLRFYSSSTRPANGGTHQPALSNGQAGGLADGLGEKAAVVEKPRPRLEPAALEALADEFAAVIPEEAVTSSALQAYLMRFKRRPEEAARGAECWVEDGFPNQPVATFKS